MKPTIICILFLWTAFAPVRAQQEKEAYQLEMEELSVQGKRSVETSRYSTDYLGFADPA